MLFGMKLCPGLAVVFLWSSVKGYYHNTRLNMSEHIPSNPEHTVIRGDWASYHCGRENTCHWSAELCKDGEGWGWEGEGWRIERPYQRWGGGLNISPPPKEKQKQEEEIKWCVKWRRNNGLGQATWCRSDAVMVQKGGEVEEWQGDFIGFWRTVGIWRELEISENESAAQMQCREQHLQY